MVVSLAERLANPGETRIMTAAPLSTYAALCRGMLLFPDDDVRRFALADWLDENEGTVACPESSCGNPAIGWNGFHRCHTCSSTGRVSNGNAERAELYLVGIELVQAAGGCEKHGRVGGECDPGGMRADASSCSVCNHRKRLQARERELIAFGRPAGWWEIEWLSNIDAADPSKLLYCPRGLPGLMIEAFVRRGSIDEIRLPAAAFTEELARAVWSRFPVTKCVITDAVVHKSGGNDTYYLGGLGRFPAPYWRSLEGLPTRAAVLESCQAACVRWGRSLAGLTLNSVHDLGNTGPVCAFTTS